MTISNMLTNGTDNSSCSMFCEHNALSILNKKKMYFIACRFCFLVIACRFCFLVIIGVIWFAGNRRPIRLSWC